MEVPYRIETKGGFSCHVGGVGEGSMSKSRDNGCTMGILVESTLRFQGPVFKRVEGYYEEDLKGITVSVYEKKCLTGLDGWMMIIVEIL